MLIGLFVFFAFVLSPVSAACPDSCTCLGTLITCRGSVALLDLPSFQQYETVQISDFYSNGPYYCGKIVGVHRDQYWTLDSPNWQLCLDVADCLREWGASLDPESCDGGLRTTRPVRKAPAPLSAPPTNGPSAGASPQTADSPPSDPKGGASAATPIVIVSVVVLIIIILVSWRVVAHNRAQQRATVPRTAVDHQTYTVSNPLYDVTSDRQANDTGQRSGTAQPTHGTQTASENQTATAVVEQQSPVLPAVGGGGGIKKEPGGGGGGANIKQEAPVQLDDDGGGGGGSIKEQEAGGGAADIKQEAAPVQLDDDGGGGLADGDLMGSHTPPLARSTPKHQIATFDLQANESAALLEPTLVDMDLDALISPAIQLVVEDDQTPSTSTYTSAAEQEEEDDASRTAQRSGAGLAKRLKTKKRRRGTDDPPSHDAKAEEKGLDTPGGASDDGGGIKEHPPVTSDLQANDGDPTLKHTPRTHLKTTRDRIVTRSVDAPHKKTKSVISG